MRCTRPTAAATGRNPFPRAAGCAARRLRSSIARRDDRGGFGHEHHGALAGARAVHDALRHDEALVRLELDRALLEVDDEAPLEHEEELIVVVVLVPVVLH